MQGVTHATGTADQTRQTCSNQLDWGSTAQPVRATPGNIIPPSRICAVGWGRFLISRLAVEVATEFRIDRDQRAPQEAHRRRQLAGSTYQVQDEFDMFSLQMTLPNPSTA